MLNDLKLIQEMNDGSRDVGKGEENKVPLDLLSLVFQLFGEVQTDVGGEVEVGGGEEDGNHNQFAREDCLVDDLMPLGGIWNNCRVHIKRIDGKEDANCRKECSRHLQTSSHLADLLRRFV